MGYPSEPHPKEKRTKMTSDIKYRIQWIFLVPIFSLTFVKFRTYIEFRIFDDKDDRFSFLINL